MFTVYKHICPNGKVYIGITSKPLKERWQNGKAYKSNAHFWNAITKYGWDNIKHEILFEGLTKEEAEQKEIALIAQHKSNLPERGYNRSTGGECSAKGCKWSEEHNKKTSDTLKGHFVSEATREKIKRARRLQKTIINPPVLRGSKNPKAKQIIQKDIFGETIAIYETVRLAAQCVGVCHQSISDCCRGKLKSVKGFVFCYAWR